MQRRVLEAGLLRGKDVLAASETGSGKTLAFGLPIMQQILLNGAVTCLLRTIFVWCDEFLWD